MKTSLNLQEWRLADLRPAEYNPREELHPGDPDYEALRLSIETNGYVDPIIINSDGTIIGGHQRYRVLSDLGYDVTQVVVVDADKDQEKALNIALNKISGRWDELKLKDLLVELDLSDIGILTTGFSKDELDDLKIKFDVQAAEDDEDFDENAAYKEARKDTRTRKGDVWILGDHRLMCGDSTRAEDMAKLMDGELADLVITDPPYNVAYEDKVADTSAAMGVEVGREHSQIQNDDMPEEEFTQFLSKFYKVTADVMREGAAIYVFHADSNGLQFRQTFQDAGLKLAQCLIWVKNTFVPGRQDYQWQHEPVLYGWKPGTAHHFVDDRTQSTIFNEDKPRKSDLHPTMKPVSLVGKFMQNSSAPDWSVLDPFGGSGTTIMAAEQLGRRAYMMELDEIYCDVIIKRWEEFTGEKAVKA